MTTRRTFIQSLMGVAAAGASVARAATHGHRFDPLAQRMAVGKVDEKAGHPIEVEARQAQALKLRQECALHQSQRPMPEQQPNGDEQNLPCWMGSFTKGLPHNQLGEVEPGKYEALLDALASGKPADFKHLERAAGRPLVNPQAAYAFGLEGADSCALSCRPGPSLSSAEGAAEMVELYWQALARDVLFAEYESSPLIQQATAELSRLSGFAGPREPVASGWRTHDAFRHVCDEATQALNCADMANGAMSAPPKGSRASTAAKSSSDPVTVATLFRGTSPGDTKGPLISQFLWKPVPYGSGRLDQRYRVPVKGIDYLNSYEEWLQLQNGFPPWRKPGFEPEYRYIISGRDLAEYVHFDYPYQAFLNTALILENVGPENLLNTPAYLSETNPYKYPKNQMGFVTFGCAHIADWLGRVITPALKAAWFQKWMVHRRLRPEEFGGRVHLCKTGSAEYPIHSDVMKSAAIEEVRRRYGNYLLPQSYAEACPQHPAYPAGHAAIAGACATVLKAFFAEDVVVPDCVVPTVDGRSLQPYHGPALTVKGEVEKLAFNIAMGRNFAGIHYRSDASAGIRLGEEVTISVMEDLVNTFNEDFDGFKFTRFDGTPVHIQKMM